MTQLVLYQVPTLEQQQMAHQWLEIFEIVDWKKERFLNLSYGQKMLCLLIRALVKTPQLLILDEPCQGLDYGVRQQILKILILLSLI